MRRVSFLLLAAVCSCTGFAQLRYLQGKGEMQTSATSLHTVPFWLRSNQFGSIPPAGVSLSFLGGLRKDFDTIRKPLWDWGMAVKTRINLGSHSRLIIPEAYLKGRLSIFELHLGRSEQVMGLVDTTLSSGAFAVSGNALGIPKIELGITEFYSLPVLGKIFAIKGNFAHGWLGHTELQYYLGRGKSERTYFHQKSLYGRLGKPGWKFNLLAGFNHQAYWGNEKSSFGEIFKLSKLQTYKSVIFGEIVEQSKVGNHLGSIDIGFTWDFRRARLFVYRQHFYDVGALYYLANALDGLNGFSLTNRLLPKGNFHWKKVLFEVFYSKNQAGQKWSRRTPSGDEDYYNNYIYRRGWSYKSAGLGNPLISPANTTRKGQPNYPGDYFINNRVVAFHTGIECHFKNWELTSKLTYSRNFGTYGTHPNGHTTFYFATPPIYGFFKPVGQLSAYLESGRKMGNGYYFGCVAAFDVGRLLEPAAAVVFKVSKSFP